MVTDASLYKKAVLWQNRKPHYAVCKIQYVLKFTAASRSSPCDSTAIVVFAAL